MNYCYRYHICLLHICSVWNSLSEFDFGGIYWVYQLFTCVSCLIWFICLYFWGTYVSCTNVSLLAYCIFAIPLWTVGVISICIFDFMTGSVNICLLFRTTLYQSKNVCDLGTFVLFALCLVPLFCVLIAAWFSGLSYCYKS